MRVGAAYLGGDRCEFTVWAPDKQSVSLEILSPAPQTVSLTKGDRGYWRAVVTTPPDTRYGYRIDGGELRPDPASHFQPEDVHGPSAVVDHSAYLWGDRDWQGLPLADYVIYELHVGTFSPEGTFEAIVPRLADLKALGVTAIELMPVAQFPGDRNWGYDGVYPYAVQTSYGGPEGLKKLVDACHQAGIAVVLDVVYNHFGPEGNYTAEFGPYFTEQYRTPWGSAINFDHAHSDGVRNFFIQNALHWFRDYHIDALRLDAIHAIYDFGAKHFLQELAEATALLSQAEGRPRYLIAESDLNDVRVIRPRDLGGYGLDAQWSDDFHHALRTVLTDENIGYYADFGRCEQLATAMEESFVYSWRYSPFRQRYHGSDARDRPPVQFVVSSRNHDQIGNRMLGERLSVLTSFDGLKLAAATVLLSPYIPLLFMGEEYGEEAPFLYFISHTDADLVEAVRQGRREEFADFHAEGEAPDPFSRETFERSTLNWELRQSGKHQVLLSFYQALLALRRSRPALRTLTRQNLQAIGHDDSKLLILQRSAAENHLWAAFNYSLQPQTVGDRPPQGTWEKILDSAEPQWQGAGATAPEKLTPAGETLTLPAQSLVLYERRF